MTDNNRPVRIPRVRFNNEDIIRRQEEAVAAIARNNRRRIANPSGQVLDTIGIEFESLGLPRDTVARILGYLPKGLGNNFNVHRDGSAEMNAYYLMSPNERNGILVNFHTEAAQKLFSGGQVITSGYELISVPMDISTAEETLYYLLPILEYSGDFISERCATHIHVGAMKNLSFCKNSLKLGLWFDEVFFSLAHMGQGKFRGYSNNAIYARPLINGPYFSADAGYYQVLNWEKALTATDLYEFFACYGINLGGDLPKYHPARYFSINLYSIPRIGTLEFRHFNQSFNPVLTSAIARTCQVFVEIAMRAKSRDLQSLEPGNVFETYSPSHYIEKLHKFANMAEELECEYTLDDDDITELSRTIYSYNGIGIRNTEVLTHCRDFNIPPSLIVEGELKRAENKPIKDGHIDIHNIKWQSIIK